MPAPGGFGPLGPDRKSRSEPAASEDGDPVFGPIIHASRKCGSEATLCSSRRSLEPSASSI